MVWPQRQRSQLYHPMVSIALMRFKCTGNDKMRFEQCFVFAGGMEGGGGSEGVKLAPLKRRFLGCVCEH